MRRTAAGRWRRGRVLRSGLSRWGGTPMFRCTSSAVKPRVRVPTTITVSHSVIRPNLRRSRSSSSPSCAIADDGASMPVARAMATGNASATAMGAAWPGSGVAGEPERGVRKSPQMSTTTARTTNAAVITANTVRPRWPNQVPVATPAINSSAIRVRRSARAGKNAMIAEAAAAVLMAMVRPKSTISAAMGMNALPSPKASAAAAGAPPPWG